MNKDSDDGFHLLSFTTGKQCPRDTTEQSFAPTAFGARVSLTFSTIHVLEYEAAVAVKSLAYMLCRTDSTGLSTHKQMTVLHVIYKHRVNNQKDDCTVGQSVSAYLSVR